MKRFCVLLGSLGLVLLFLAGISSAAPIVEGWEFSVSDDDNFPVTIGVGTHFHSSITPNGFETDPYLVEVGYLGPYETVHGLSEFDLNGLAESASAYLTFHVFSAGGLFADDADNPHDNFNDFTFDGEIDVFAYQGNNFEDIEDYHTATTNLIGRFSTANLQVGDVLGVDILGVFNTAINNGWESLGIRLQTTPATDDNYPVAGLTPRGAWTFNDFSFDTEDISNIDPWVPVPEPATIVLLCTGLIGILGFGRNKIKK